MPEKYKGQFGPRVIGEEAYEAEQTEVVEEKRDVFGDRVVGESNMVAEAPDEPAAPEEEGAEWPEGYTREKSGAYYAVYDPEGEMVESDRPSGKWHGTDAALEAAWEHAEAEESAAAEASEPEEQGEEEGEQTPIADATIEEAKAALEEQPELVDRFLRAEIERPDGVRADVLDALENAEARKDVSRDEVFETIDSLRAGLPGEE